MPLSASRHTIFAILSAIEDDLRTFLRNHISHLDTEAPIPPAIWEKVCERWKSDFGISSIAPTFIDAVEYLDFADSYAMLNRHRGHLPDDLGRTVRALTPVLDQLVPIRNRIAHGRPLHSNDLAVTTDAADEIRKSPADWSSLRDTHRRLEDDASFVLGLTIPVEDDALHNLPTPEWEETGFLGRADQLKNVLHFLKGPYPVISLVGEGGVGKTSLALKAAYDVLDSPDFDYEAVVWTSSKTTKITPAEIVRIEGAISSSLGLLQDAALALGVQARSGEDAFAEVLSYLETFRVLLILDNLETVLDDNLERFFASLPLGSKVLTTSRIGLGAFEQPIKLTPMRSGEAAQLLRSLARVRGLGEIATGHQQNIESYCTRLQNNPGFIKWFVSAVATGARPEEALANPGVFLDFCMSNIYDHLSEGARGVLRVLLCVAGQLSQAELAHYTDLEVIELQRALKELLSTNMVSRSTVTAAGRSESVYEIMELARLYLARNVPGTNLEYEFANRKRSELESHRRTLQRYTTDRYSPSNVTVRDRAEIAVSKYLQQALAATTRGEAGLALDAVHQARALAPDYFEVHRVEGQVRALQGDLGAARQAFEAALDCGREQAPLLFFYAEFLYHHAGDNDYAVQMYQRACELDESRSDLKVALGKALLQSQRVEEAHATLVDLSHGSDLHSSTDESLLEFELHYYEECAIAHMLDGDVASALTYLEQMADVFGGSPARNVGKLARDRMRHALAVLNVGTVRHTRDEFERERRIVRDFKDLIASHAPAVADQGSRNFSMGRVKAVMDFYGWIRGDDGREFFFHANELPIRAEWESFMVGAQVRFREGRGPKGPRALDVSLEVATNPQ